MKHNKTKLRHFQYTSKSLTVPRGLAHAVSASACIKHFIVHRCIVHVIKYY